MSGKFTLRQAVPPTTRSSTNRTVINADRVTGLATPVSNEDAANKAYVDASGGGSPGGATTNVQFNNAGAFDGDAAFTFDTDTVSIQSNLDLLGSTSGTMTLSPAAAVTDYALVFPAAQGGANEILENDGSGNLSWTTVTASAGGSDTEVQFNNSGSLDGVSSWTTNGTTTLSAADNGVLNIGTGNDFSITHDATDTTITSTTGDLVIDNTNVTGETRIELATATVATSFSVRDSTNLPLILAQGSGQVDISGNLDVSGGIDIDADLVPLTIGSGGEFQIVYNGSETTMTSTTGNLTIANTDVTNGTLFTLGTATSATTFEVQDVGNGQLMVITGAGDVSFPTDLEITLGASADFTINHNGTNTVLTSNTGDFIIDNTATIGSSIARLGTDTTATDFQVQNNSETAAFTVFGDSTAAFAGELTMGTNKITNVVDPTADQDAATKKYVDDNAGGGGSPGGADTQVQFNNSSAFGGISSWTTNGTTTFAGADNAVLSVGTGSDWSVTHDGTDTTMTSTTGNLTIDNTDTSGQIFIDLGSDTLATAFFCPR